MPTRPIMTGPDVSKMEWEHYLYALGRVLLSAAWSLRRCAVSFELRNLNLEPWSLTGLPCPVRGYRLKGPFCALPEPWA